MDDLEAVVDAIATRGIEPAKRETYGNGVRKATYRDCDGNEIGFGGAPLAGLSRIAGRSSLLDEFDPVAVRVADEAQA